MKRAIAAVTALAAVLVAGLAQAQVSTKEETLGDRKAMVLENPFVKLVVLPDPGGTVIEFTNKKTGTNFVAGGDNVLKGRTGFAWKDYYWLEALDQGGKGIFTLPYKAEFRAGKGGKSIFVSCETEGLRVERDMLLAENSPELTVSIKHTNVSDKPRRLQVRWHAYSQVGDPFAERSMVLSPDVNGEVRKCFIGSGWDHQFITADGYWLAANAKTGEGLWMTFKKEQSGMHMTWTDYNHTRKTPSRGMVVLEPFPAAILAQPGQSVEYQGTFFAVTADLADKDISLGVLTDPAEQARARQFLAMVRPNLDVIWPFTMTPGDPPAGLGGKPDENRFDFSHRRRDRFALRPWGFLDAMLAVPGVQNQSVRCRHYARFFDSVQKAPKVSFRFQVIDATGRVVKEKTQDYALDLTKGREIDVRDDVPMAGLADGSYRFVIEGFVEGEKDPIHRYEETRRLVGQARPEYEKRKTDRETAPIVERPFVTALRKIVLPKSEKGNVAVPIGVEDGSGIARKGWPVRCGVPFAQGMLPKGSSFELLAPDGKPVPVQTEPMATWPDGSLKWVLVEFEANVPADGHAFYTLKGKPGSVTTTETVINQKDGAFEQRIASGTMRAAPGKRLFDLFRDDDLWWEDGQGRKYYFRLQGEGAGYTVEENGPLRGVLKAIGWYFDDANRPVCMGELRMEYYRNRHFIKLFHTVMYAGDPWREKLGSYGIRFHLDNAPFTEASISVDGKPVTGAQVGVLQQSSDACQVTVDGKTTAGARALGAVVFSGGTPGKTAFYHRDFWQMAPKKVVADTKAKTVTFSYWPTEAGAMSFLPREDGWIPNSSSAEAIAVGMSRTHEIIIDLDSTTAVTDYEKVFGEPVAAIVPPKYMAGTKALMHLSPYDPGRYQQLERVISDTIDYFQANRELFGWYGEWTYGGIPNWWRQDQFRWLDFGRYAWILNEEDIVDGPWLAWLRSGDRKYLKFAELNTRHLMEVGTIRWNPAWPTYEGLSRRHHECIWLGGGDTGHSMLDPFLDYYYSTGYRPARDAAERMARGMAKVTNGSWRYISNPVAGLSRMYLDTQNPFYKEHADRIWNTLCYPERNDWWVMDHGERMAMWYSQINPQCKELWKAWTLNPDKKGRFTGADVLTALYLETGDAKYAQAAAKDIPKKMPSVTLTQHTLAAFRAWCYAGEAVAGAAAPTK